MPEASKKRSTERGHSPDFRPGGLGRRRVACALFLPLLLLVFACAEVRFLGNSQGQLKPAPENTVSPQSAMDLARVHLPLAWALRCRFVHRGDPHWCGKTPTDYIVQQGDFYFVTRTSYPYKTIHAYTRYAVRIHVRTAEVLPPTAP